MNDKIQSQHLARAAYVYVRQSTGHQVRHHHQGRQRQYDLSVRARELAFSQVVVVDDDQGKTGTGLVERPGFDTLLSAVCRSEVGAVFALEASRLARNNQDWHHLIELCALTETLIIDADGIYDPRTLNDRLLLGLKGTMSEFELGLFRQRARQAFEMKVAQGHAMWEVPVGFERHEDDRVEMIADRQVQSAIAGVFLKFRELASARQTALWYRDEKITLPEVIPGTRGREVVWRLPRVGRITRMLKNPCYAGALAYGRTEVRVSIENGRARRSRAQAPKPRDEWKVLILDHHLGYITWQEYLENQVMLESNASPRAATGKGAAKKGPALLAGLLRCGHCGRKLFVAYNGRDGRQPRYACHGGREHRGSAACQALGGMAIDRVVAATVLEATQPAGIQASLEALALLEQQQDEKRKSLELALEKAHYEVDRARRQYDLVDPANRLVASELEARWNATLARVTELERQLAEYDEQVQPLTSQQRRELVELGRDLPALWNHPATTADLKKRLLRCVLEEILISDHDQRRKHRLVLHWKGGSHTELVMPRNGPGQKRHDTKKTALELIEELSKVCSDATIAATLNRLGYKTGGGKTWRTHSVHNARHIHRLVNHRQRGKRSNWVTVQEAVTELGVSRTVIERLIRQQTLPATQVVPTTPWIIARESLRLPAVQREVEAIKCGRQLRRHDATQQEIPFI